MDDNLDFKEARLDCAEGMEGREEGMKKQRMEGEMQIIPSILILAVPVRAAPNDQVTQNMYKYSMSTGSIRSTDR